jgi:hypothetical protein
VAGGEAHWIRQAGCIVSGLPAAAQQEAESFRAPVTSSLAPLPEPERGTPACAEPRVELVALRGGRTRVAVDAPCRAQQLAIFTYAGAIFIKSLDQDGRTAFTLDCFAGDSEPLTIRFEDQTTVVRRPVVGEDMRDFSKVAIVWSSTVDLDLHAFEYSATFGSQGHVWSEQPRSLDEAASARDGRGHGFLSTASAGGEIGMNMEVYTFVHQRGEAGGVVKLAVEYKSRGAKPAGRFCGSGDLAELRFKAYILERDSPLRTLDLAFAPVPCGVDISPGAQINARLIPDLIIRR